MKKLALTIAIVLGLGLTTFADPNGGGLFQRGETPEYKGLYNTREGESPLLPELPNHAQETNQDGTLPIGSGIAVLAALGGAYLVAKKRREE